jgi:hypothetical protein
MVMNTVEDRIGTVLRTERGMHLCEGCLALEVKATLAEAQAAVAALNRDNGFQVAQGDCASCQRQKTVVCAMPAGR